MSRYPWPIERGPRTPVIRMLLPRHGVVRTGRLRRPKSIGDAVALSNWSGIAAQSDGPNQSSRRLPCMINLVSLRWPPFGSREKPVCRNMNRYYKANGTPERSEMADAERGHNPGSIMTATSPLQAGRSSTGIPSSPTTGARSSPSSAGTKRASFKPLSISAKSAATALRSVFSATGGPSFTAR